QLYLAIEDIDHTRTKARSPQTNGICERFPRTILEELYQAAFRKRLYRSLEEIQTDVDTWGAHYNQDRPHSGKFCPERTPMQTFLETKHLAREKQLDLFFEGKEMPSDPVVTDFAYTVR